MPVRLALEGLEERMLLSANTDGLGLPSLASDLRQFQNDLTAAVSLVNTSQPGRSPDATANQWSEAWNTLAADANKVWQGFVQAEFAALGAIRQEFDSLLNNLGLGSSDSQLSVILPTAGSNSTAAASSTRAIADPPLPKASTGQAKLKPALSPPLPSVYFGSTIRGQEGANLEVFVAISTASGQPVTVQYATSDGTATAGKDYQATSGTLTIPAGQSGAYFSVQTLDDNAVNEPSTETLTLTLSNPSGATLGSPSTTTAQISEDSDGGTNLPPPTVAPPCSNDG